MFIDTAQEHNNRDLGSWKLTDGTEIPAAIDHEYAQRELKHAQTPGVRKPSWSVSAPTRSDYGRMGGLTTQGRRRRGDDPYPLTEEKIAQYDAEEALRKARKGHGCNALCPEHGDPRDTSMGTVAS